MRFAFFLCLTVLLTYVAIRPILKSRPSLKAFYEIEDNWWVAAACKLRTIRTKLLAAFVMAASAAVTLYDTFLPAIMGVDWSPITEDLPSWAWPLVSFGVGALFLYLRRLTDKNNEVVEESLKQGNTLDQAKRDAGIGI